MQNLNQIHWLPCYEDKTPDFVYDLFKPLKKLSETMCCELCNRIECESACHSKILLDRETFDFVAIVPKEVNVKNTIALDIGDVFRCIDEEDLWLLIKEKMY